MPGMQNKNKTSISQVSDNKPDRFLFIIGAMKAGTTSLFEILSQHPRICPCKTKEPDYFVDDSDESSREDYLNLWDWQDSTHLIALESSVAYSKAPLISSVPERIYNSKIGQYRFIYMLRNPLTRIESQVRHGLFAGWGESLDAGIPEDAIYYSSYAMQLDKYLKYFSIDNILLITLEEFKNHPEEVLSRVCRFLEIDTNFKFQDISATRNSGDFFNASASVSRITQSNFGQFIANNILPVRIKNWLRKTITHLNKRSDQTTSLGRWKLTSKERNTILDRLSDDLKRLESEFGVDVQKYWDTHSETLDNT